MLDRAPLGPGVYDLPAEVYHADPCAVPSLSAGLAKELLGRSPLHAFTKSQRLNPDFEPTERKTFDLGRAAHRAVLGKGGEFLAIPDELLASNGAASTKEAKAFIEDARANGLTPLKSEEVDRIGEIAASVSAKLALMGIRLDPARSELTAIAEIEGTWCRAMPDNAPADPRLPIYDLKTCEDASPDAVVRAIAAYRYDVQAAHYLDVWRAATGEARKFRFVFVEKAAPFEVSVVELHDRPGDEADWFDHARADISDARRIWRECLEAKHWPGYPARVAIVGAPGWHTSRLESRAALRGSSPSPTAQTIAAAAAWQAP